MCFIGKQGKEQFVEYVECGQGQRGLRGGFHVPPGAPSRTTRPPQGRKG